MNPLTCGIYKNKVNKDINRNIEKEFKLIVAREEGG